MTLSRYAAVLCLIPLLWAQTAGSRQEAYDDPDLFFDPPRQWNQKSKSSVRATDAAGFSMGIVTSSFNNNDDRARAIAMQPDGKLVLGGGADNGTDTDAALLRYHIDGQLDTSFHTSGKYLFALGSQDDYIHGVAVQTDGKAVTVGKGKFYNWDFTLSRHQSDGSLDTAFHTDGKAAVEIFDNTDIARGITIQTDGKYLVAGYSWLFGQYNFVLSRFLTNGVLDTSFNSRGFNLTMLSASDSGALAVAIDPTTGRGIVTGPVFTGDWNFGAIRYLENGSLDTSFNTSGKKIFDFLASEDRAQAIDVNETGTIAITGWATGLDPDAAVARLLTSGTLDTSFHTDGKFTADVNTGTDYLYSTKIQSNGAIVSGGYVNDGASDEHGFLVLRNAVDGTLDTSFHTDGLQYDQSATSNTDTIYGMMLLPDNSIFVSGFVNVNNRDFAVARYASDGTFGISGTLDVSFGTQGTVNLGGHGVGISVYSYANGRLGSNSTTRAVRVMANGDLDTSFNTAGYATYAGLSNATCAALQTDGAVVIFGDTIPNLLAARLTTDGVLDSSFHTDGYSVTAAPNALNSGRRACGIHTNGSISGGGKAGFLANATNHELARWTSDGVLDVNFSGDGLATFDPSGVDDSTRGLAIWPNNSIVMVGSDDDNNDGTIFRFLSNGTLDTSFRTGAYQAYTGVNQFTDVAIDLGLGYSYATGPDADFLLVRFDSTGALDTSFNTSGKKTTDIGSTSADTSAGLLVQGNGKIVVGGKSDDNWAIARYLSDGTLDTAFNTVGTHTADLGSTDSITTLTVSRGKLCATGGVGGFRAFGCYWP